MYMSEGTFAHIAVHIVWFSKFVFVLVLQPSQSNEVMLSRISLPNHTFTGQA